MTMQNKPISDDASIAAGQSLKEQSYWMEKFSGAPIHVHFPFDTVSVDTAGHPYNTVTRVLEEKLSQRLINLSGNSDYTLHIVLTAGVALLLNKYTCSGDITVGTTIEKQEAEGDFINTILPLRTPVQEEMTFKELLISVRQTVVEAVENQNYPMETLIYDLKMIYSRDEFPLFDTVVLLESIHDKKYMKELRPGTLFLFRRLEDKLVLDLEYKSHSYKEETMERLSNHFVDLLEHAVFNVDMSVGELDMLSEAEKKQLLFGFNGLRTEPPAPQTIHELFQRQVTVGPDNIAVIYNGDSLTYRELDRKARHLAEILQKKGVVPGAIVGILAHRSTNMIVGLMAVLMAGGAYLPLDPEYPEQRLRFMIEDSRATLLLNTLSVEKPAWFSGELIDLEDSVLASLGHEKTGLKTSNAAQDRAYIIFTSGSSGRPKGVAVSHAAITNTLHWRKHYYGFHEKDVVLQVPSFAFDSSVEDIFTTLISGAALVMVPQKNLLDLAHIAHLVETHRVTHFLIVPSFYQAFLDEIPSALKGVRAIAVAGDQFTEALVKKHFENLPDTRLFNEYGPAENSVCTTVYEFAPDRTAVLIGKPIHNVNCHVLNAHNKLAPLGVPAELCVSGAGLADEYLGHPGLAAQKFGPHPYLANTRMYRTGDLVRWLPDGNLEFLGRVDQQVKIRGARVEIGEVEYRLQQFPGIKKAAVIPRQDDRGDRYLCAYVVTTDSLEVSQLLEYLQECLPDYMVPAHFVELSELPLSPNGKIDRKKLAEEDDSIKLGVEYVAPRNHLEEQLVAIWRQELELEKVGIKENFFNIGGNSIKSIGLLNTINRNLQTQLKVVDLYVNNTIEKLAGKIERQPAQPSEDALQEASQELDELRSRLLG